MDNSISAKPLGPKFGRRSSLHYADEGQQPEMRSNGNVGIANPPFPLSIQRSLGTVLLTTFWDELKPLFLEFLGNRERMNCASGDTHNTTHGNNNTFLRIRSIQIWHENEWKTKQLCCLPT
ncbi:hypothetical protein LAZ67_X001296 [Cordylochernes scorpioides]|uniref:Uncharacterized protein n=1 Tax=Cordylochernes scorpioides TaxID=51811 RepID=A0ABY6LWE7_9ARAC|nr:hypothetical protein LAZ67_X001296 [Cordylochernes scorpioides]